MATISDHAIARYYERVGGLRKKDLERLILDDNATQNIALHGDGVYKSKTHYVVVKSNVVVTVLSERQIERDEYREHRRAWLQRELDLIQKKNDKKEAKFIKRAGEESLMTKWYIAGHREKEKELKEKLLQIAEEHKPNQSK